MICEFLLENKKSPQMFRQFFSAIWLHDSLLPIKRLGQAEAQ